MSAKRQHQHQTAGRDRHVSCFAGVARELGISDDELFETRLKAPVASVPIRYGSVCSGIEAATVAWVPLGWKAQWFAEIKRFPSAVLAHHYPSVPNLGDITRIYNRQAFVEHDIDLLVGGTPCQSWSSAGKGAGLADPRGQLAIEFLRIAAVKKPRWLVWENVPRVLSCHGGMDFAFFLEQIRNLGYSFAYRILDAQHFGVPQRRRRIYLVGYLGDWRPPVLALFEPKDLQPARQKRPKMQRLSDFLGQLTDGDLPISVDTYNNAVTGDVAATLGAHAYGRTNIGPKILDKHGIRTPTPTECERLMGVPDNYTLVDYPCRTKRNLEIHRIKSLGNSMAVPVMRWLGERIAMVEAGLPSRRPLPTQPASRGDAL